MQADEESRAGKAEELRVAMQRKTQRNVARNAEKCGKKYRNESCRTLRKA
jgi:hypothetical protein